jgi:hypothetical protein
VACTARLPSQVSSLSRKGSTGPESTKSNVIEEQSCPMTLLKPDRENGHKPNVLSETNSDIQVEIDKISRGRGGEGTRDIARAGPEGDTVLSI